MSDPREIRVEHLLARRVHDSNGKYVGRIEEIRAERDGTELRVSEFHVGSYALLERMSAIGIARALLRFAKLRHGYRVPWDQLDLVNPNKPRTTVPVEDLKTLRT